VSVKQPLQQEVLLTFQATPNEIIALNHLLAAFFRSQEGQQQGKKQDEIVVLLERFFHRIGTSNHTPLQKKYL
jgi:hypothetical protein